MKCAVISHKEGGDCGVRPSCDPPVTQIGKQQMTVPGAKRIARGLQRRYQQLAQPAREGHKSITRQLTELCLARLRGQPLTLDEYYQFGLFNTELFEDAEIVRFVGKYGKEWVHKQLNNIRWEGMVTDKLIMYSLLDHFGIPHPRIQALICDIARYAGTLPVIRQVDDLADFLQHRAHYPLFCKAVKGSYGRGSRRIESFDTDARTLHLSTGQSVALEPFLQSCLLGNRFGFLLQDAAEPTPQLHEIVGNLVSGLRMVVFVGDDKATLYRTLWKIPCGNNYIDNFSGGTTGNLVANIDVSTGTVTRVFGGSGLNAKLDLPHPDSGAILDGLVIPGWNDISKMVLRAATCFPDFRWQHWDVGITKSGPTIFELNSAGNTDTIQLASGKGLLDPTLIDFLRKYGH